MKSRPGRTVPTVLRRRFGWLLGACVAVATVAGVAARASNPSALWQIVHGKCVPDQQHSHRPAPCTAVNLRHGYAILKDIRGKYQFLLIPTARVSGIGDPAILAPHAPNYWQAAWDARRYVEQRAGHTLPRDFLALAINSSVGRSQNQLHIHVDCIRPDVRVALQRHQAAIGPHWSNFPVPLAGDRYRAMRIDQPQLGALNPFRLLARSIPPAQMRWHTLVLAGMTFGAQPGFVLLDNRADLAAGDRASGERLEDHSCTLLR